MDAAKTKKWVCYFLPALFLLVQSNNAAAKLIYGFQEAQHFRSASKGPFFIQAGAFNNKAYAAALRAALLRKGHSPVEVRFERHHYAVLIGPLSSVAKVHALGCAKSSNVVVRREPMVKQQVIDTASETSAVEENHVLEAIIEPAPRHIMTPPVHNDKLVAYHEKRKSWILGFDVDATNINLPRVVTVHNGSDFASSHNLDTYSTHGRQSSGIFGVQVGERWQEGPDERWWPATSLSLRYQHLFKQDITGTVTQYSLPQFENYNYRVSTGADLFSLHSKFDLLQLKRFMPYVNGGVGVALDRTTKYQETYIPPVTARISPAFQARNNAQFYYDVGAGIDFALNRSFLLSLGYDFQSFGPMMTGNGIDTWSGENLKFGTATSNSAVLGLTWLLDDLRLTHFYEK